MPPSLGPDGASYFLPRTTKEEFMPRRTRLNFRSVPSPREIEWTRNLGRWKSIGLLGRAFCRREGPGCSCSAH